MKAKRQTYLLQLSRVIKVSKGVWVYAASFWLKFWAMPQEYFPLVSVSSFILLYKIYDICSSSSFPTGAPGGVGNGFGGHGGGGFHSHHHPHHYVDPFKLFESVFAGKDPFDFHRQFHHSASVDPFASFFQVSPADITGMPCTVVKLGIPKFWGISLPHFLCTQFDESLIEPHSK